MLNDAAMAVGTRVDRIFRDLAMLRLGEFRPELGRALVGEAVEEMIRRLDRQAVTRPLKPNEQSELVEALTPSYGDHLAVEPLYDDVAALCRAAVPGSSPWAWSMTGPTSLTRPPARWSRHASSWARSWVPGHQICSRGSPIA